MVAEKKRENIQIGYRYSQCLEAVHDDYDVFVNKTPLPNVFCLMTGPFSLSVNFSELRLPMRPALSSGSGLHTYQKTVDVWLVDSQPELNSSFKNYVATAEQNARHSDASWEDSRRYQCPKCFKTYAQKRTLDRHLKNFWFLSGPKGAGLKSSNLYLHAGPAIWSPVHHLKTAQIDTQDSFHSEPVLSPQHKQTEIFQCEDCVTRLLGQDVFSKRSTPKHASSTSKDVSFERQEPGPSVHKIHFGQDVDSISSKMTFINNDPQTLVLKYLQHLQVHTCSIFKCMPARLIEVKGEGFAVNGTTSHNTSKSSQYIATKRTAMSIESEEDWREKGSEGREGGTKRGLCRSVIELEEASRIAQVEEVSTTRAEPPSVVLSQAWFSSRASCRKTASFILWNCVLERGEYNRLLSRLPSDTSRLPTSSPSCAQTDTCCQLLLPLALRHIRAANCFSLLLSDTSGPIRAANFFSLLRSDQSGLPTFSPSCAQTNPGYRLVSLLLSDTSGLANLFALLRPDTSGLPTYSPSGAQIHPGCHLLLPLAPRHIRAANLFSHLRSDTYGCQLLLPLTLRPIRVANLFSLLRSDQSGLPTFSLSCAQTNSGYRLFSLLLSDTSGLPTFSPSCSQTHPGCQLILPLALKYIRTANFFSLLRSDTSGLLTSSPSCVQTHSVCQLLLPLALRYIQAANFLSLSLG
uniref:C2H2-type domain-containing protein n=1 Tax=Timema poppense TaxID=170557 RepID=A0A7R9CYY4_TIMPO|nr:unnamed protein product [Timema poppensis]